MADQPETTPRKPVSGGQQNADRAAERLHNSKSDKTKEGRHQHQDELLDESVEETFPASDPISPKQIT